MCPPRWAMSIEDPLSLVSDSLAFALSRHSSNFRERQAHPTHEDDSRWLALTLTFEHAIQGHSSCRCLRSANGVLELPGDYANSSCARIIRSATVTPCGHRTTQVGHRSQRTDWCSADMRRKCSRPRGNWP